MGGTEGRFEILQRFGDRLTSLRVTRGLTQDELSALCGLTRAQIVNLEMGRSWVGPVSLRDLCAGLQINPSDLLNGLW